MYHLSVCVRVRGVYWVASPRPPFCNQLITLKRWSGSGSKVNCVTPPPHSSQYVLPYINPQCLDACSAALSLWVCVYLISKYSSHFGDISVFLGKRDAANFLPAFMCSLLCVYILVREGLPSPAQSTPCVCNPCQLSPQSNLSTTISWDVTRTCVCECVCMCPGRWGWCQTESINCSPSVCAAQCVCVRVCEPLIPCIPAPSLFLWICIHIWCVYICICAFSAIFLFYFSDAHCWISSGWFCHGGEYSSFFFFFFLLFWFLSGCGIPAPDFPFLHAWKPSYLPTSPLNPLHPTPRTSPLAIPLSNPQEKEPQLGQRASAGPPVHPWMENSKNWRN